MGTIIATIVAILSLIGAYFGIKRKGTNEAITEGLAEQRKRYTAWQLEKLKREQITKLKVDKIVAEIEEEKADADAAITKGERPKTTLDGDWPWQ